MKKRDRKEVHMDPPHRKSMREELRGKKQEEVAKAKNDFAWQDVLKVGISGGKRRKYE